jgi:hypothetical protein
MPYEFHPSVEPPEDQSQKIWRYVDLTQFMSIIERGTLYFNRADNFEDPFEGEYPQANFEDRGEIVDSMREWAEAMEESNPEWDSEATEFMIDSVKQGPPLNAFENRRMMFYLNCWHMNEYQSAAMWDLYSDGPVGIAIQSTYGALKRAFEGTEFTVNIGKVDYIDFQDTPIPEDNILHTMLHKRKSFEHESELRAIIDKLPTTGEVEYDEEVGAPRKEIDWENVDDGLYVPVELEELIETIFISPRSPSWARKLVEDICETYDIQSEIKQSDLYDGPVR